MQIFVDDTFVFSKVLDVNESIKELHYTLNGFFNGECSLILIPTNRVMKSYFLKNQNSILIPFLLSTIMMLSPYQKHLGVK